MIGLGILKRILRKSVHEVNVHLVEGAFESTVTVPAIDEDGNQVGVNEVNQSSFVMFSVGMQVPKNAKDPKDVRTVTQITVSRFGRRADIYFDDGVVTTYKRYRYIYTIM